MAGESGGPETFDLGDQDTARVGLLGWLASLDGRLRAPPGKPGVLSLDRRVCTAFQIGFLPGRGPFLGYPAQLWWFDRVWGGAAAGSGGVALIADYATPFALFLPGEWPKTLTEYARAGAAFGEIALCPTRVAEAAPADARSGLPGHDRDDLDLDRVVPLPYLESVPWLDALLHSL